MPTVPSCNWVKPIQCQKTSYTYFWSSWLTLLALLSGFNLFNHPSAHLCLRKKVKKKSITSNILFWGKRSPAVIMPPCCAPVMCVSIHLGICSRGQCLGRQTSNLCKLISEIFQILHSGVWNVSLAILALALICKMWQNSNSVKNIICIFCHVKILSIPLYKIVILP